jgi:hypothetical protein
MNCPNCGGVTIVTRICYRNDGDQRRRKCTDCGFAFYTVERMEAADTAQAFQATMFKLVTDSSRDQARRMCIERKEID